MHPERLFFLCNSLAPVGWLMMILAPRWKWTDRVVLSGLLPLLLAVVYLFIIAFEFWNAEGDFASLAGVAKLFENPYALTAAWIHYLAFDMFIGAWEIRDSRKHN